MGSIDDWISGQQAALAKAALSLKDEYYSIRDTRPYPPAAGEGAKYQINVVVGRAGVAIHWRRLHFIQEGEKWLPRAQHLKRGKVFKYPAKTFKQAPAWEAEAIASIEDRAAAIRRKSAVLAQIGRLATMWATQGGDLEVPEGGMEAVMGGGGGDDMVG